MKVLELLSELEELVTKGNTVPFSNKAMVDPQEFMEILDEIRVALPPEMAESRKIVAERKQIIFEAEAEAKQLKSDVEKKLRQVITKDEISKQAQARAEAIVAAANKHAKEIKTGTQQYSDKILYNLQLKLKALNDTIEDNRKELKQIVE